ncbi:MAG: aspartate-semialdehyde dehydrogenase [Candidatus Altiarchaeota archaeon]|nr:aspartate-semialdehyde dehydrogenase [Candidatus Altiarchaeota archaeon]
MKLKVGLLGATGMVGQRFIQALQDHPWFEIASLMASERSAGKKYCDAAKWYLKESIPEGVSDMTVEEMDVKVAEKHDLRIVFSAIPSDYAREIEASFAKNIAVFSNTSTYRMDKDVPIIVPEVNSDHLGLIEAQKKNRGWDGFIVTNPNCSTAGLVVPLKPIADAYGIKSVTVATMQALSGAGYDGVPSMAILDNIIPHIKGEEEKMELESLKIMGRLDKNVIRNADFGIFASCNRVMVIDGHTEAVFLHTDKDFKLEELTGKMRNFKSEPQKMGLPTAPRQPIIIADKDDRPQPRFDRDAGAGMAVTVGRLRKKKEKELKFTCLSHNTIRGAAGASVLNAELAYKKKLI